MIYSNLPVKRSITIDEMGRLLASSGGGFGATRTRSGAYIGPDASLKIGAHAACLRLLAKTMSMIPCNVRRRRKSGGSDIATQYPLHNVLTLRANKELLMTQWQTSRVYNRGLWGNSVDVIDRDSLGRVVALWPAMWPNVSISRWDGLGELTQYDDMGPGDLAYTITTTWPAWSQKTWPASRILHIQDATCINGVIGLAPTDMLKRTLGVALALRMFEEDFYGDGIRPSMIGTLSSPVGSEKIKEMIKDFVDSYGGWKSGGGLLIPNFPVDLKPVDFKLDYASLSEGERSVVQEICGFHGIPPTLIGHAGEEYGSTYSNAYQFAQQFLTYAILPMAKNDENHFNADLLTPEQRRLYFCEYDYTPLKQMDPEMMSKWIRELFFTGAIQPDEIRAMNSMNPLDDGKGQDTYIQSSMIKIGEEPEEIEEPQKPAGLRIVTPEEEMDNAENE